MHVWELIVTPRIAWGVSGLVRLLLLELCEEFGLSISCTCFKHKANYITTRMHPRSKMWHLIMSLFENVTWKMFAILGLSMGLNIGLTTLSSDPSSSCTLRWNLGEIIKFYQSVWTSLSLRFRELSRNWEEDLTNLSHETLSTMKCLILLQTFSNSHKLKIKIVLMKTMKLSNIFWHSKRTSMLWLYKL